MLQCVKVLLFNRDSILVYYLRLYIYLWVEVLLVMQKQVLISVQVVKYKVLVIYKYM